MSDCVFSRDYLPESTYPPSCDQVDISICLVNWNTRDMLADCIRSINANRGDLMLEIFVIDNASKDGSVELVKQEFPEVVLISNPVNYGFARANNQGIQQATGRYVLLLNPDTVVLPDAMQSMVAFLESVPDAGAVAPKLLNTNGSLQYSLRKFPTILTPFTENPSLWNAPVMRKYSDKSRLHEWDHNSLREVDQPAGAAFMIKRAVVDTLGDLNSSYHMFFEDVDLCYRIKQNGWKIFYLPDSKIIHHGGQSVKQRQNIGDEFYKSMIKYFRFHHGSAGERKIRISMVIGSLGYLAYAVVKAVTKPRSALNLGRNAVALIRAAIRYRISSEPVSAGSGA